MPRSTRLCTFLVVLGLATTTLATDVSYWTHGSTDDFSQGTLESLVVTNYGDIQLTRRLDTLAEGVAGVSIVYALAEGPDGAIYAGTGPRGVLLRVRDGSTERFEIPGATNLFALAFDAEGRLLVGAGGDQARVLRVGLEGESVQVEELLVARDALYVWRIARHADGTLYVATGPSAALYEIKPDGTSRRLFQAPGEKNLLSLAMTEGDDIYVGTDPNGLIWHVNRASGEARVIFDAAEPEITAIVVSGRAVFATGAARGEVVPEEEMGAGTPDVLGSAARIARQPVELPEGPELPPQGPDRIPLNTGQDAPPEQDPPPGQEPPPGQDDPQQDDPEQPGPQRPDLPDLTDQPEEDALSGNGNGYGPTIADFLGEGSAVYRIDLSAEGAPLVTGVLRDPALFLDLVQQDGRLLLAAGAGQEGQTSRIIQLNPATNEMALLAEPNARQVVTMLPARDGRVLLGLANPGGVAVLGAGFAATGTYTSPVLDAGAVSRFGTIQLVGRLPQASELSVSTRSGSTGDPEIDAAGWGEWSEPVEARRFVQIETPQARFFQYRLSFRSDGSTTPSVERVRVAYLQPNLPPQVTSLQVNSELTGREVGDIVNDAMQANAPPSTLRGVEWEANDPNGDPLTFDLYMRRDQRGEFQLLAAGLTDPAYAWDAQAAGDGIYEFRVVASDARGNPAGAALTGSRVSEPVEIDLSAPRIGDIRVERGEQVTTVTLRIADADGIVARLEYLLNGDPADPANWIRAFPVDTMADSPQERYTLELSDVPPGGGTLRLRAVDDSGNLAWESVRLPAR